MELVLIGLPAAAVVAALVEVIKRTANLDTRWAPLVAIAFGVLLACMARLDDPSIGTWFQTAMMGIMAGLSASGLYSGQKSLRGL